jgi:Ca2+:H+ antiporter
LIITILAIRKGLPELVQASITGSILQTALFVAPLLVFVSLAMGNSLTLILNQFELLALGAAVCIAALISLGGESNGLEGAQLPAGYIILALAFFLLPT